MILPRKLDLQITKGSTFSLVETLSLETTPLVYKPITGITKAGPVAITATGHGLVTGWRAVVWAAGGTRQINAKQWPPRSTDFHLVTKSTVDVVAFNDVDSEGFTTYTSGGSLVYFTPLSIATCTARMMIRATAGAADPALVSLASPTDITLDDTNHAITVAIAATVTAAYTFSAGVYDLELVTAAGVVTKLLSGNIVVFDEVTR
jgi:hypothetical protein